MERLSDEGDQFNYDFAFDRFEMVAKGYVRNGKISFGDYNLLLIKYG